MNDDNSEIIMDDNNSEIIMDDNNSEIIMDDDNSEIPFDVYFETIMSVYSGVRHIPVDIAEILNEHDVEKSEQIMERQLYRNDPLGISKNWTADCVITCQWRSGVDRKMEGRLFYHVSQLRAIRASIDVQIGRPVLDVSETSSARIVKLLLKSGDAHIRPLLNASKSKDAHIDRPLLNASKSKDVHIDGPLLNASKSSDAHINGPLLNASKWSDAHLDGPLLNASKSKDAHIDGSLLNASKSSNAHSGGLLLNASKSNNAHIDGPLLNASKSSDAHIDGISLNAVKSSNARINRSMMTFDDLRYFDPLLNTSQLDDLRNDKPLSNASKMVDSNKGKTLLNASKSNAIYTIDQPVIPSCNPITINDLRYFDLLLSNASKMVDLNKGKPLLNSTNPGDRRNIGKKIHNEDMSKSNKKRRNPRIIVQQWLNAAESDRSHDGVNYNDYYLGYNCNYDDTYHANLFNPDINKNKREHEDNHLRSVKANKNVDSQMKIKHFSTSETEIKNKDVDSQMNPETTKKNVNLQAIRGVSSLIREQEIRLQILNNMLTMHIIQPEIIREQIKIASLLVEKMRRESEKLNHSVAINNTGKITNDEEIRIDEQLLMINDRPIEIKNDGQIMMKYDGQVTKNDGHIAIENNAGECTSNHYVIVTKEKIDHQLIYESLQTDKPGLALQVCNTYLPSVMFSEAAEFDEYFEVRATFNVDGTNYTFDGRNKRKRLAKNNAARCVVAWFFLNYLYNESYVDCYSREKHSPNNSSPYGHGGDITLEVCNLRKLIRENALRSHGEISKFSTVGIEDDIKKKSNESGNTLESGEKFPNYLRENAIVSGSIGKTIAEKNVLSAGFPVNIENNVSKITRVSGDISKTTAENNNILSCLNIRNHVSNKINNPRIKENWTTDCKTAGWSQSEVHIGRKLEGRLFYDISKLRAMCASLDVLIDRPLLDVSKTSSARIMNFLLNSSKSSNAHTNASKSSDARYGKPMMNSTKFVNLRSDVPLLNTSESCDKRIDNPLLASESGEERIDKPMINSTEFDNLRSDVPLLNTSESSDKRIDNPLLASESGEERIDKPFLNKPKFSDVQIDRLLMNASKSSDARNVRPTMNTSESGDTLNDKRCLSESATFGQRECASNHNLIVNEAQINHQLIYESLYTDKPWLALQVCNIYLPSVKFSEATEFEGYFEVIATFNIDDTNYTFGGKNKEKLLAKNNAARCVVAWFFPNYLENETFIEYYLRNSDSQNDSASYSCGSDINPEVWNSRELIHENDPKLRSVISKISTVNVQDNITKIFGNNSESREKFANIMQENAIVSTSLGKTIAENNLLLAEFPIKIKNSVSKISYVSSVAAKMITENNIFSSLDNRNNFSSQICETNAEINNSSRLDIGGNVPSNKCETSAVNNVSFILNKLNNIPKNQEEINVGDTIYLSASNNPNIIPKNQEEIDVGDTIYLSASNNPNIIPKNQEDIDVGDTIYSLVQEKFKQLRQSGEHESYHYDFDVLSGIVLVRNDDYKNGEVVAIGTGNRTIVSREVSSRGDVVHDHHAEIICLRALRKYFYAQLDLLQTVPAQSIFEQQTKPECPMVQFTLKRGLSFHLYVSSAPCGDARAYSEQIQKNVIKKARGQLRKKEVGTNTGTLNSNHGSETLNFKSVCEGSAQFVTACCSDKIARANVIGVQGAILCNIIEPIYLGSLTVGRLYVNEHLSRAINERITLSDNAILPKPYRVNFAALYNAINEKEPYYMTRSPKYSLNWVSGEHRVEACVCTTGKTMKGEPSRLCKMSLYKAFVLFCKKCTAFDFASRSYAKCKALNENYQTAKKILYDHFKNQDKGYWIVKDPEWDEFYVNVE